MGKVLRVLLSVTFVLSLPIWLAGCAGTCDVNICTDTSPAYQQMTDDQAAEMTSALGAL